MSIQMSRSENDMYLKWPGPVIWGSSLRDKNCLQGPSRCSRVWEHNPWGLLRSELILLFPIASERQVKRIQSTSKTWSSYQASQNGNDVDVIPKYFQKILITLQKRCNEIPFLKYFSFSIIILVLCFNFKTRVAKLLRLGLVRSYASSGNHRFWFVINGSGVRDRWILMTSPGISAISHRVRFLALQFI